METNLVHLMFLNSEHVPVFQNGIRKEIKTRFNQQKNLFEMLLTNN
jgi:hypothetical protein